MDNQALRGQWRTACSMPTRSYEYHCQTCGRLFEKLRRMADADKQLECPDCQSKKVERTVSGFAMASCGTGSGGRFT